MPKRYKADEHTPETFGKDYIFFLTGWRFWTAGTWTRDPISSGKGVFECRSYQGDIDYYCLSEIDWWLDPMEVEE